MPFICKTGRTAPAKVKINFKFRANNILPVPLCSALYKSTKHNCVLNRFDHEPSSKQGWEVPKENASPWEGVP